MQVVRCCIEHAASVAKTFLTSDAVVIYIDEPAPKRRRRPMPDLGDPAPRRRRPMPDLGDLSPSSRRRPMPDLGDLAPSSRRRPMPSLGDLAPSRRRPMPSPGDFTSPHPNDSVSCSIAHIHKV